MNKQRESIAVNNNNLARYYEYRVYDKKLGFSEMRNSEYEPCPIVIMSRHQGFQWNEELFVSAYRRSAGYECHKSPLLEDRDKRISSTTNQTLQDNSTDVIDIHLTEAECDVWP